MITYEEKQLWIAVMMQALQDTVSRNAEIKEDARAFFVDYGKEHSLKYICDALQINYRTIIENYKNGVHSLTEYLQALADKRVKGKYASKQF